METKELSYEEAIVEINTILAKFKSDKMSIDELSAQVKRATELIELCRNKLHGTEQEVNKILEN